MTVKTVQTLSHKALASGQVFVFQGLNDGPLEGPLYAMLIFMIIHL